MATNWKTGSTCGGSRSPRWREMSAGCVGRRRCAPGAPAWAAATAYCRPPASVAEGERDDKRVDHTDRGHRRP